MMFKRWNNFVQLGPKILLQIKKSWHQKTTERLLATNIISLSRDEENKILCLQWADGKTGRFPYAWLRDTSPDPDTYSISESMTARKLFMRDFEVEISPDSARLSPDRLSLFIQWPCGTNTQLTSQWLRARNLADPKVAGLRRQVYLDETKSWGSEEISNRLKRFAYKDVIDRDEILHDFLEAVCVDGIALIRDSPCLPDSGIAERGAIKAVGQRIGLIQQTHFGEIFEVCTKPDASNMAYSSASELPLHADYPSLTLSPELQMLHMIERAEEGGCNTFCDGFRIAEQLKQEQPTAYRLLTTIPLEYIEKGFDTHKSANNSPDVTYTYNMVARHKVITLNEEGVPTNVHFGNAMRSWFYDTEVENILPMYRAMKLFTDYCYQPRNLFSLQLENGDMVLWANTRLLHARTPFKSVDGRPHGRLLEGCYFGWDFVRSRIRTIRASLNHPKNQSSI